MVSPVSLLSAVALKYLSLYLWPTKQKAIACFGKKKNQQDGREFGLL